MNDLTEIIQKILVSDERQLDILLQALLSRRKTLRDARSFDVLATTFPGDRVKLSGLSPKYLNGCTGVVVNVTSKNIEVRLEPPVRGRYTVLVPAQCIEHIEV